MSDGRVRMFARRRRCQGAEEALRLGPCAIRSSLVVPLSYFNECVYVSKRGGKCRKRGKRNRPKIKRWRKGNGIGAIDSAG